MGETIRKWLDEVNFDWDSGVVIIQDLIEPEESINAPGWAGPGDLYPGKIITQDNKTLNKSFSARYGAPECPRFIAKDKRCIYFPEQYDGSTDICFVYHDITEYLEVTNTDEPKPIRLTPYPGG